MRWPVTGQSPVLCFLGNVVEYVMAEKLQGFLDVTPALNQLQSGFRSGFDTETAVVALVDNIHLKWTRGSLSC